MGPRAQSTRRDQLIDTAADLLREGGPDALTTVAVAARCGITQPAVYRHVESIDTLTVLASSIVLDELRTALEGIVDAADGGGAGVDGSEDTPAGIARIVELMSEHAGAYEIVDRWRHVDGPLGAGIDEVMTVGQEIIAFMLELRWRSETGATAPLDDETRRAQMTHAALIRDEGHAVARFVRDPDRLLDETEIGHLLANRFETGWAAYAADIGRRCGGPDGASAPAMR